MIVTPEHSFWTLTNSNIKEQSTARWIREGLVKCTLNAVCDGSYQPKLTTKGISTGWIIESKVQQSIIW